MAKEGQRRLPPVLPLVVYHGGRAWSVSTRFSALIEADEELLPHLLDFSFAVADLGRIEDEALSQDARLRSALMAMKYAFQSAGGLLIIPEIGKGARGDPEFAKLVLRYLIQTHRGLTMADVQAYVEEAFPGEAEHYASMFAQEMMSKGRQEGRQEEAANVLRRQLQKKFGPSFPHWVNDKLTTASLEELENWIDRILDARSLDEIFVS